MTNQTYLVLLESGAQYEAYIAARARLETHEALICCLSMAGVNYCLERAIPFILPDDCYTEEESSRYRGFSEQKIKALVKDLNAYYHEKIGDTDGFHFDMGSYHYFILYHFFGALHYRAFVIWKIIERHRVDRILVPQGPDSFREARPFPVTQYPNCYLDLCLNSVYKEKVIPVPMQVKVTRQYRTLRTIIREALSKCLRKIFAINYYLNCIRNNIPFKPWTLLAGQAGRDIVLLGTAGPWKHVFGDPRLKDRVGVACEMAEVRIPPDAVRNWFAEWFNWEDVFCGFNITALGHYEMGRVKLLSERIISSHRKTLNGLQQKRALIYAVAPFAHQQYFLSVAKHLGLQRVCFQHGEMSLYYPGLWNEASELLYPSHYFSFGEQVSAEKTRCSASVPGFKHAISIGSPGLDLLKARSESKGSYILYASAKFMDHGAGFVPRYCDMAIRTSQHLIIDYFESYLQLNPDATVIWKQNQERLTGQPEKKVERVRIVREEQTFSEMLPAATIVILDRPSTTSLEACMTEKPLFALLANRNWYPLPEKLLRKRAVVAYTPETLRDALDDYLTKGIYPADVTNREFVRAYGAHLDDGCAARRAADALMALLEKPREPDYNLAPSAIFRAPHEAA